MELRHLRYFRAVAEELHFNRAAERLNIAQPPLSQQIRQLENELGVTLFRRSTRKVELTPAGQRYLQDVVTILGAVDDAAEQARLVADGQRGHLSIGCVGSATYSLLPQLVRELRDQLPGINVSIRGEMLAPAQIEALLAGTIDVALLRPPVVHPGVTTMAIRRDRLLVALPADHPLAGSTELRPADLRDADFVVHAGHGRSAMSGVVTGLCAEAGFVPRIRHSVEETSTLLTLVAAGLGLAVVPSPTAALGIPAVAYVPLGPGSVGIDLLAATRDLDRSTLIDRVLAVLRRVAAE
ncbi:LysR substrate-binding domain-containing protein [Mycolicibacterium komossense]|uniref:LysR family transcriptional regulator n=1 Tax=Mycolicibacterium komossense TaxID=1779 RepID=A0ABT3CBY0_9MYCO|nr:LysR substrate-binding domain-containing protein [Mycolicibacterium komossense]MCV7226941.1 LysR family transcriptional regulator [Mycolicibacterium komossense]